MLPPQPSKSGTQWAFEKQLNLWNFTCKYSIFNSYIFSFFKKIKRVPPLPFSKLTAIYQSIQLTSPELSHHLLIVKVCGSFVSSSHAHYGNGRWMYTKGWSISVLLAFRPIILPTRGWSTYCSRFGSILASTYHTSVGQLWAKPSPDTDKYILEANTPGQPL